MSALKKRSGRIIIYILLILIAASILAFLLLSRGRGASRGETAVAPTPAFEIVDIVVASQFIPRGQIITSEVLTTLAYPKNQLVQGTFFTSIEDAVGTKAKYNIDPAVPLTSSMVIHEGGGSLAAFDIPAGMMAYSLAVSPETAVAYAPRQGDHVLVVGCMLISDVDTSYQTRLPNDTVITFGVQSTVEEPSGAISLGVMPPGAPYNDGDAISRGRYELDSTVNQPIYVVPSEVQRPRLVCQTVIQDAMVLNVGMFALDDSPAAPAAAPAEPVATEEAPAPTGPAYPGSITIVVSPQDTLILNYLALAGAKLSLALKSAGDGAQFSTDPVTLQYIMDQKNIPAPVKLPYGVEPRVDTLLYPAFDNYILNQP